jgi:hypothetical protein
MNMSEASNLAVCVNHELVAKEIILEVLSSTESEKINIDSMISDANEKVEVKHSKILDISDVDIIKWNIRKIVNFLVNW